MGLPSHALCSAPSGLPPVFPGSFFCHYSFLLYHHYYSDGSHRRATQACSALCSCLTYGYSITTPPATCMLPCLLPSFLLMQQVHLPHVLCCAHTSSMCCSRTRQMYALQTARTWRISHALCSNTPPRTNTKFLQANKASHQRNCAVRDEILRKAVALLPDEPLIPCYSRVVHPVSSTYPKSALLPKRATDTVQTTNSTVKITSSVFLMVLG